MNLLNSNPFASSAARPGPSSFLLFLLFMVAATPLVARPVSALGRVHPISGVVNLFGPSGEAVTEVLVREGEWVERGQPIARFSGYETSLFRRDAARERLDAVRDREKLELAAKDIEISGLEAELELAEERLERVRKSEVARFAAPDLIQERLLTRLRAENRLEITRMQRSLLELSLRAELRDAQAALAEEESALRRAELRSPLRARVLKSLVQPGHVVGNRELFKLGDTSRMVVVAEVYEADVARVREGRPARITSAALPQPVNGTVDAVGHMIFKDTVDSLDPTALTNTRVVEVKIIMDEPGILERLVYLQVDVEILP